MISDSEFRAWQAKKQQRNQEQGQKQSPLQGPEDLGSLASFLLAGRNGLEQFGAGIAQPALESSLVPGSTREWSKERQQGRQKELSNLSYHHPYATAIGHTVGETLPTLPAYGIKAAQAAKGLWQGVKTGAKGGARGGAISGAAQYTNDDESRLGNSLTGGIVGGTLGSALPVAGTLTKAAGRGVKDAYQFLAKALGDKDLIAKDLTQGIAPGSYNRVLQNREAGERLGLNLSPHEASGHPGVKARESRLGVFPENAEKLIEHRAEQKHLRKNAVEELSAVIGSNKGNPGKEVQEAASSIIDKEKSKIQAKATPYYQKAESDEISPNKLNSLLNKDGIISQAYEKVTSSPIYERDLRGHKGTSIKVLDQVKKHLDDQYERLMRTGESHEASLVLKSKKRLVTAMDDVSPNYKKARGIYSSDLPTVKAIEESPIGTIANFDAKQLKNIPKTIFDPKETQLDVLKDVRAKIVKENPDAWGKIVRKGLEERISHRSPSGAGSPDIGSRFYKNVLSSEADYTQFQAALQGNKPAQKKLADMRSAFRYVIAHPIPPGTTGKEQGFKDTLISKLKSGKYDKAAVELLTSGEWDKHLRAHVAKGTQKQKVNTLLPLLQRVASKGTQAAAATKATETEGR